jgi:hypothetical protein
MTDGPRYDPMFNTSDAEWYRFVAQVGPFDVWTQDRNDNKWRFAVFPKREDMISFFDFYWQRAQYMSGPLSADEEVLRVAITLMGEGPV